MVAGGSRRLCIRRRNSNVKEEQPVLTGSFGAGGSGPVARILFALLFAGIQVLILTGVFDVDLRRPGAWMPGVIAVLLLLLNLAYRAARGTFALYPDRVVLSQRGDDKEPVYFSRAAKVELGEVSVAMRDAEGQVVLRLFRPQPLRSAGWLWMLHQYRDDIPPEVTGKLRPLEWQEKELQKVRVFLGAEGEELFFDTGIVLKSGDDRWFFPVADTLVVPQRKAGLTSMDRALSQVVQPLRFSPSPALLPLADWVQGIANHASETDRAGWVDALAEAHGGVRLSPTAEAGQFTCEWDGLKAEVFD